MNRHHLLACGFALLLLAGCDTSPEPDSSQKATLENTRLAVTRIGKPFDVEGCEMQAYRVTTSNQTPNFTVVKANCAGVQMQATQQSCGKNCSQSTVQLTPTPASGDAPDPRRAELEALAAQMKKARAELDAMDARMRELQGIAPSANQATPARKGG